VTQPLSANRLHSPRLLSLATAVPKHILGQETVSETARHIFGMAGVADLDRMVAVFGHAGIDRRYSTVPVEWYEKPHGWTDRNNLYLEHALALI
jgi:alkylresorcinol/alkylpyrone synthase